MGDLLRAQEACPVGGRACREQQIHGADSTGGLRGRHRCTLGHGVVLRKVPGGVLPSGWHEQDVLDEPLSAGRRCLGVEHLREDPEARGGGRAVVEESTSRLTSADPCTWSFLISACEFFFPAA